MSDTPSSTAAGPSEYLPRAGFHGDYLRLWREVVAAYGLQLRPEDARLLLP